MAITVISSLLLPQTGMLNMKYLVTGAGGNLGKAVVNKLLNENHQVVAIYGHTDEIPGDEVSCVKVEADLMDTEATQKSIDEHASGIDGVIHTVGGFGMGDLASTSLEDVEHMIRLNFNTSFNVIRAAVPHLANGGKVFMIGARPALHPEQGKGVMAYAISKGMLFHLAEMLNAAYDHIDVAMVVPSIIDTPPNRKAMPDADFSDWVTPDQIADAIFFHLENDYIRESVIKVYGNV